VSSAKSNPKLSCSRVDGRVTKDWAGAYAEERLATTARTNNFIILMKCKSDKRSKMALCGKRRLEICVLCFCLRHFCRRLHNLHEIGEDEAKTILPPTDERKKGKSNPEVYLHKGPGYLAMENDSYSSYDMR
jgi:hypothetical protein